MRAQQRQGGFTLVEIAIVMVIIGLLLGGALQGQEMIENARTKRVKADFDQISAAFYSYQDIYRAFPGDNGNANVQHNGTNATGNNANNRVINGDWGTNTNTVETRLFWEHLRTAGLIAGNDFLQPTNAFGGIIGIEDNVGPANDQMNGLSLCFSNLNNTTTRIIDNQYDDGNGTTGSFRVIAAGNNPNATNLQAAYNDHTANDEILCIQM